jgi:hypothetical protein
MLRIGGLVEVAGASSDLYAEGKSTVEPAGVAGLDEQVNPEVMLCVGDRPPSSSARSWPRRR